MKITNQDICNAFEASFAGQCKFSYAGKVDESENLLIPIFYIAKKNGKVGYVVPIEVDWKNTSEEKSREFFDNINWAKIYKNSIDVKVNENGQIIRKKQYINYAKNAELRFVIPKEIQKIVEKKLTKIKKHDDSRTK